MTVLAIQSISWPVVPLPVVQPISSGSYAWNRGMETDTPAMLVSQLGFPGIRTYIPALGPSSSMVLGAAPAVKAIVPPTKEGLTPYDSMAARRVYNDLRSKGIGVVQSKDHLIRLMNQARDPQTREAYRHIINSGAYNKIEQRDVSNQPDGRSGTWNFESAAKVWGY